MLSALLRIAALKAFLALHPQVLPAAELLPPQFQRGSGPVPTGFAAVITNANERGAIFYALDGADPRNPTGTVASNAHSYVNPFTINRTTTVTARVLEGNAWSDSSQVTFVASNDYSKLILSEIMYQPPGTNSPQERAREFVEIKNTGSESLDLTGIEFRGFVFSQGSTIRPGEFRVLIRNTNEFLAEHPGVRIDGAYLPALLNYDSEISLNHASGAPLFKMSYSTFGPWPTTPDDHNFTRKGFSLVPVNPNHIPDPHSYHSWRPSSMEGGSPGMDDPPETRRRVFVNELLARPGPTGYPYEAVELYNPNTAEVDIGFWFLTDSRPRPKQFHVPGNTVLAGGGYLVLDERLLDNDPLNRVAFGTFESVYLYSANASRDLTGLSHGFNYMETPTGISFGRVLNSVGDEFFFPQREQSIGSSNAGPTIGPLMVSEIMYHPLPGEPQYVEIVNISTEPVSLHDLQEPWVPWEIFFSVWETLPTNATLPPGGIILKVSENPDQFRARYDVPTNVIVDGGLRTYPGYYPSRLSLYKPSGWMNTVDGPIPRDVPVDEVYFRTEFPWPSVASGGGASLERVNLSAFGNEPRNWRARPGMRSPGRLAPNWPPLVHAGGTRFALLSTEISLPAHVEDDGLPLSGSVTSWWSVISGDAQLLHTDSQSVTARFNRLGTNVLVLRASDGEQEMSDALNVVVLENSFSNWRLVHFTPTELDDSNISAKAADPDGDGLDNVSEYAAGSNPRALSSKPAIHVAAANGQLTVTTLKAATAEGVIFQAETARELSGPWRSTDVLVEISATSDPNFSQVVIRDLSPPVGQQFLRWRLELEDGSR